MSKQVLFLQKYTWCEIIKCEMVLFCLLNEMRECSVLPMFCTVTDEANKAKNRLCFI